MDTTSIVGDLRERLAAVRRRKDVAALARGSASAGTVLVGALAFALVAEALFGFGVAGRTAIFAALALLLLFLVLRQVAGPLGRLSGVLAAEGDIATAVLVGRALPRLHDRLANALQLLGDAQSRELYSGDLLDAAAADLHASCRGIDLASTVDLTRARSAGRYFLLSLMAAVLLFGLMPAGISGAAGRLLHFRETFAAPAPFRFIVEPGSREVLKGETVDVRVQVLGQRPPGVVLAHRRQGELRDEEESLTPGGDGEYRYRFPALAVTTDYEVHAQGFSSGRFTLTVMDRPLVRSLRVTVAPPAYSGLPAREQEEGAGDVTALRGSHLRVAIRSNRMLARARLVLGDSTDLPLEVAGDRASGSLLLMKERTYHVDLTDSAGTPSVDPVEYALKIIPDAPPAVTLLAPGENLDVTDTTPVPLLVKISDDFGFSRLRLAYKLVQSKYEKPAQEFSMLPLPLPPHGTTEALVPYTWSIAGLHLVPEDVVSYYAEVFDNDAVSGPKSAISEIYSLRLPSLDEVFAQADRSHDLSIGAMTDALKQAQEARREMEELAQSLRSGADKVEWQDRQKAAELLKKYDDVRARMDSVRSAVDRMVNDLSSNRVLSRETLEKYQELQHLMSEMATPEFAEAMKRLRQAMEQMSPEALRQAMQQFNLTEETFRRSIERTLQLLRRIQVEQKLDEAVRRTEELVKEQTRLHEETRGTPPGDREKTSALSREQRDLNAHMDSLAGRMQSLQGRMEEFPSEMPLGELERAGQEMRADSLRERMEGIAQNLDAMQPGEASRLQQQALSSMSRLGKHLQNAQREMRQNQQRQVLNGMRRSMRDLLDLSRRQEKLKDETEGLEPNSRLFRDNEEGQMDVMRDLGTVAEQLAALSQKTFGVTPEMGQAIGEAMKNMSQAMRSLAQRNRSAAAQEQTEAMGSLNDAAQKVADAMSALSQSGGQGMGMAGLMERLRRLSSQQGGINEASRNLGALTPAQAAEMARLAGQQEMVRKSLEDLSREAASAGELKKLLGDLKETAREMAEVQTDLLNGKFNPETARKEEHILSRLLDAQRSTRERDFEKRRTSTPGRETARESPAALDLTTMEGKSRLRRDMQKALREGYAREYEDLIRRYFEILEQLEVHPR